MVDPAFAALVVGLYGVSERGTLPRVDSDDPDADEAGSDDDA